MRYDLLITPGLLLCDADRPPVTDAAIAVLGGRIVYAGPRAGLPPGPATETLALPDHLALPGLINIHTHAALSMLRGVAEDLGFAPAYTPGVPQGGMLTEGEAVALARLGAMEAMLFGSTLIVDTYVHAAATLPAMAELGLRVIASPRIHDVDLMTVAQGDWRVDPAIGERTLGEAEALAQRFADPGLRTGVHLAAHAPDTCSAPLLRRVGDAARRLDLRVATHLSQSRVEVDRLRARDGMTPAQALETAGLLNDRLIAAHCIHVDDDDIRRIGAAGVTVAHIPKGNATGGTIAPTRRLREAGARLCLGTDNMHADMVEVMRWGLAMGRVQVGRVEDGWQPEQMLAAATRDGAAALGLRGELGVLAPGMQADVVLMDLARVHLTPHGDPLGTVMHCGVGRDVSHVVVAGEIVVRDGRPTRVDVEAVRRDGMAAAAAVWQRASR